MADIDYVSVESSNVDAIAYEPDTERLWVRFHGGAVYIYRGVPAKVHEAFVNASSKGRYLHDHIIPTYPTG